jgi:hypothetical protein
MAPKEIHGSADLDGPGETPSSWLLLFPHHKQSYPVQSHAYDWPFGLSNGFGASIHK